MQPLFLFWCLQCPFRPAVSISYNFVFFVVTTQTKIEEIFKKNDMVSAVSDDKLYWSDGDGNISSMNLDGSDSQTLISFSSRDFSDIIVVEDMLLFSDSITGYVTVVLF